MNEVDKIKLGQYCKDYRLNVIDVTLTSFSNYYSENIKNINAFESGRANNIKYIVLYANYDLSKREQFLKGLFNIL